MDAVKVCTVPSPSVPIVGGRVQVGLCNPVVNGDFRDRRGLVGTDQPGWFSGVPFGWSGRAAIYNVRQINEKHFANLHTLSREPPGPIFFQQTVGNSCCALVSLQFFVDNPYNNPLYGDYGLTYQILARGALVASGVTTGIRNDPRTVRLEAQVQAGEPITIAFRKNATNHAMGITDVVVKGVVRMPA
jgi:hypothetical protein